MKIWHNYSAKTNAPEQNAPEQNAPEQKTSLCSAESVRRPLSMALVMALMMFPQIVETIYSPALTGIAAGFGITAAEAAQTLSLYFLAFALGVVIWGWLSDRIGRRPAMLAGLTLYAVASVWAVFLTSFPLLLAARCLTALGAATGSIVTQTMMRDRYTGRQLARVFSILGMAIAVSPALGVMSGALLTSQWGYRGVFIGLAVLASMLLAWSVLRLPETRPDGYHKAAFKSVFFTMLSDTRLWGNAVLVAVFNVCLFSFYQLAPFMFARLGMETEIFGLAGIVLSLGVGAGAWLNKWLLARHWPEKRILHLSVGFLVVGGVTVHVLDGHISFVAPVVLVVAAYGMAIPNVLAGALVKYRACQGSAGAIFGLFYYLLLAGGLMLAGWSQHFSAVVVTCGLVAFGVLQIESRLQNDAQPETDLP